VDLEQAQFSWGNFTRANLKNSVMRQVKFVSAVLTEANMSGSNMNQVIMEGANLERANLEGASLFQANLTRANLRGANLVKANLSGSLLSLCQLEGANLKGADLQGASIRGARYSEDTIFPTNFNPEANGLILSPKRTAEDEQAEAETTAAAALNTLNLSASEEHGQAAPPQA
jgi:uncharacterized protein YjbI with pentapeptide repeats